MALRKPPPNAGGARSLARDRDAAPRSEYRPVERATSRSRGAHGAPEGRGVARARLRAARAATQGASVSCQRRCASPTAPRSTCGTEELAPKTIAARQGVPDRDGQDSTRARSRRAARAAGRRFGRRALGPGSSRSLGVPARARALLAAGSAAATARSLFSRHSRAQACARRRRRTRAPPGGLAPGHRRARRGHEGRLQVAFDAEGAAVGGPQLAEVPLLPVIEVDPGDRAVATVDASGRDSESSSDCIGPTASRRTDVLVQARCREDPATRYESFQSSTDGEGLATLPGASPERWSSRRSRGSLRGAGRAWNLARESSSRCPAGTTSWDEWSSPPASPSWAPRSGSTPPTERGPRCRPVAISGRERRLPRAHELPNGLAHGRASERARSLAALRDRWSAPSARAAREIVLVLEQGDACGSVIGRVVDPAGDPVANAQVKIGERGGWLHDLPNGLAVHGGSSPSPSRRTTGAFRYPGGLPVGEQPVHVTARGWPVWSGTVVVDAGRTSEIEVRLEAPATILRHGVRLDRQPCAGGRRRRHRGTRRRLVWRALPRLRCRRPTRRVASVSSASRRVSACSSRATGNARRSARGSAACSARRERRSPSSSCSSTVA